MVCRPLQLAQGAALLAFALLGIEPAHSAEIQVSLQGSDIDGDGSAARPFRSLTRALAARGPESETTVQLSPGVYSREVSGDTFPLSVLLDGSLTIRGPAQGGAVLQGGNEYVVLQVQAAKTASRPAFRLEGVEIAGGLTGVMVTGGEGAAFDAALVGNQFTGQRYQGAEVVVGAGGDGRAVVSGNRVAGGPAFAIDLGTRAGGALEIQVEENEVVDGLDGRAAPPASDPPRFGVAVYLDVAASVKGTIDRNRFTNVPVGVLLTETEVDGDPGRLDLRVSNCLLAGDPSPELNRFQHGLQLGLWPHHLTDLRILNNTVVHARGYGVYQEEPVVFVERPENGSIRIEGCIFWDVQAGELRAETGGLPLPATYRSVRDNLLPLSGLAGSAGNISADPLFGPGYQLSADSPAVDLVVSPSLPAEASRDLAGNCRIADGNGDGLYRMDLGALELPGACRSDLRLFVRGDCDQNRSLDLSDGVGTFAFLFLGGSSPSCLDACDSNDDGQVNLTDGIYTLGFLFLGGPAPPAPFPAAGEDPSADLLGVCR